MHLALLALGVGAGDEVIVPSNTYIATWPAVTHRAARVVPVEPIEATYNIDPEQLEAAITARAKVILPVHLYGQPADVDATLEVAARHGLKVLDDCAQAHAATYKGRKTGSLADASMLQLGAFTPANLGVFGDAGAVTTGNAIARQVSQRGEGFNSQLDEVQAAVLDAKLRKLYTATERRRAIAARYLQALQGLPLVLPYVAPFANPSWHLFVRHLERDAFQKRLAERGIGTLIHYPVPPHLQPAYADMGWRPGSFQLAEAIHEQVLSLPIWPGMSIDQVESVIGAVRSCAQFLCCGHVVDMPDGHESCPRFAGSRERHE